MTTRIFIDMDGVIVDFDGYASEQGLTADQVKVTPGAYRAMRPMPGALVAVRELIALGFEVWIATKPPTGVAGAYAEKAAWIFEHLPELERRIIITHHKGLLGSSRDFLVDDRPHKAGCHEFTGKVLVFTPDQGWPTVLAHFQQLAHKQRESFAAG